ncbi:MAG: Na(+)-translocating NADH-quinone reductase subunit A [Melioribacteraceae bacterium]|nr:MAG: Na(+)-translocating NADH-quinone reductase subunit A [Melioribacteraceae bacterium]
MGKIKLKKGLNLPISGEPKQSVSDGKQVTKVALLGEDYVGMKPTLEVEVGDTVKTGQLLFTDKKLPQVRYTSPGTGKVVEINRGYKRAFKSIVIELQGNEEIEFTSYKEGELNSLGAGKVKELLLESGMWPVIRTRPFSKVADPDATPNSIFVTAMDTNPLAPDVAKVIAGKEKEFKNGLTILSQLSEGNLFVCKSPGAEIPVIDKAKVEEFEGPHPAGNVGTHIHFLDPVSRKKQVWYVTAQNVVAIGHLFTTGKLYVDHIVALAGPQVKEPRLIKTRLGASVTELVAGELSDGENRVIIGSVLSGVKAEDNVAYVGRNTLQISVIAEEREKEFLGWLSPGTNKYSVKNIFLSALAPGKKFNFGTAINGGERAIVPSEGYEQVVPLDILPTYLLRAIAVKDLESAEQLGVLELDEEDLALCTFVCPSKSNFGPMLRENLTIIEKEG